MKEEDEVEKHIRVSNKKKMSTFYTTINIDEERNYNKVSEIEFNLNSVNSLEKSERLGV